MKRIVLICILVIGLPAGVHAASILTGAFLDQDQVMAQEGTLFKSVQITPEIILGHGVYDILFPTRCTVYGFEAQSVEKEAYPLTDPAWASGPLWSALLPSVEASRIPRNNPSRPVSGSTGLAVFGALLVGSGIVLKRTAPVPQRQQPSPISLPHTPSWKVVRLEDRIRVVPSELHASLTTREKSAPFGVRTDSQRA